jgi:hypothetical protein
MSPTKYPHDRFSFVIILLHRGKGWQKIFSVLNGCNTRRRTSGVPSQSQQPQIAKLHRPRLHGVRPLPGGHVERRTSGVPADGQSRLAHADAFLGGRTRVLTPSRVTVPPLVLFDSIPLHSAPLHHHSQATLYALAVQFSPTREDSSITQTACDYGCGHTTAPVFRTLAEANFVASVRSDRLATRKGIAASWSNGPRYFGFKSRPI